MIHYLLNASTILLHISHSGRRWRFKVPDVPDRHQSRPMSKKHLHAMPVPDSGRAAIQPCQETIIGCVVGPDSGFVPDNWAVAWMRGFWPIVLANCPCVGPVYRCPSGLGVGNYKVRGTTSVLGRLQTTGL